MTTADKFRKAVEVQIDQFRREFSLSYAEAIGVLELLKADLIAEARDEEEDE